MSSPAFATKASPTRPESLLGLKALLGLSLTFCGLVAVSEKIVGFFSLLMLGLSLTFCGLVSPYSELVDPRDVLIMTLLALDLLPSL